jgi:hypothetical protein
MTLMKSLLLGSAAGIVAVASAQAADLPTRKGAPAAAYVQICSITVNGKPVVGWTLPGSDTCFKLSGYVTGQVEGGNLKTGQSVNNYNGGLIAGIPGNHPGVFLGNTGSGQSPSGTLGRPDLGYTTRLNFGFDAVSNTAYGPLVAHAEMQFENGNGFDNTGSGAYINLAYVTWAGITAGKAPSFFSFTGGGPGWANFFSPDQQGFNQPDLLAYTASFGGGFSATIAAQSAGMNCPGFGPLATSGGITPAGGVLGSLTQAPGFGCSGGGTNISDLGDNHSYNGMRAPDGVANFKVSQGWGSAQVSGVAHDVTVTGWSGAVQKTWGWGIDAGVSFNLPQFGAGDEITFTGAWTQNAAWYSGIPDGMWGEEGAVNGNGQQMAIADTYLNPDGVTWSKPTIWSVSSEVTHHFSPEFSGSLEGSYGQVRWTNLTPTSMVSNSNTWLAGVVAHWDPVKNLDFEFELLYQYATTVQPNGFIPGFTNPAWVKVGDGFAARFEVTRSW